MLVKDQKKPFNKSDSCRTLNFSTLIDDLQKMQKTILQEDEPGFTLVTQLSEIDSFYL